MRLKFQSAAKAFVLLRNSSSSEYIKHAKQRLRCAVCERVAYQAKQTNKPSQAKAIPSPHEGGANKQTLLLVCFQLFAFLCHIFISSPAVCQLFCARYLCPSHVYWLSSAARQAVPAPTACLPTHLTRFRTYRRDYFWLWLHFLLRVLWAASFIVPCLWLLHCFARRSPHLISLLSSRFMLSTFIALWITRPVRACERARQLATRRIHNAPNDVSSTAGIIAFYGFSIAAICPL